MNDYLFEKVKNYFSGKMSHDDKIMFEIEIKTNKDLADIYELYQTIDEGIDGTIKYSDEEALLIQSLKKIQQQYDINKHSSNGEEPLEKVILPNDYSLVDEEKSHNKKELFINKAWKSYAIAASIIGLITLGTIWLLKEEKSSVVTSRNEKTNKPSTTLISDSAQQKDSNRNIALQNEQKAKEDSSNQKKIIQTRAERERLYTLHFKPDAIPPSSHIVLQEALEHYRRGAYTDAIAAIDINAIKTSLEDLRSRGNQNSAEELEEKQTIFYALYYKALSYMGTSRPEKAILELHAAITNRPGKLWQTKVQWYLALAYLKTEKTAEAKKLLNEIAQKKTAQHFRQKALKLINQLEKSTVI